MNKPFDWYKFFDRHDNKVWLYLLLVITDSMFGRLIYLAGACQHAQIKGDYPSLIPMHRALNTFRIMMKSRYERWIAAGHSRCNFD